MEFPKMRTLHCFPGSTNMCLVLLLGLASSSAGQSTAANQWTWMSGSSTIGAHCPNSFCGRPGVYGVLGIPAAANVPGSRSDAIAWSDPGGNLWLFGGAGFDAGGTNFLLNDLWEF